MKISQSVETVACRLCDVEIPLLDMTEVGDEHRIIVSGNVAFTLEFRHYGYWGYELKAEKKIHLSELPLEPRKDWVAFVKKLEAWVSEKPAI